MGHKAAHKKVEGQRLSVVARLLIAGGTVVVVAGIAVVVLLLVGKPSVSVAQGGQSLFRVSVSGLGSNLRSLHVTTDGQPLAVTAGQDGYIPASALAQDQAVHVTASVKSPSWLGWLVGGGATTSETLHTPAAKPATDVAVASTTDEVQVTFDHTVSVVRYQVGGGKAKTVQLESPSQTANLKVPAAPAGSLTVSAAPWTWEKTAKEATKVTWFAPPTGTNPVALVSPSPGSESAQPNSPITVTFDKPVSQVLGSTRPSLSPKVDGTWSEPSPDTLVFTPSGFGYGPGASETVSFDRVVSAVGATAATTTDSSTASRSFSFATSQGSMTRLEQMLADLHYLPLTFTPASGTTMPTTLSEEVAAIDNPPAGTFGWRWASTPAALQQFWSVGSSNTMLKGALMAFEAAQSGSAYDGYQYPTETVSEIATPSLWNALIQADIAGKTDPYPYAYAYVSKSLPETITLWENGSVVLTSKVNTGIPQGPTADGTFPVYLRFTQNWMNGTNPDGSKYHDMVYWISYFNGSDAVHAFPRASYGYPQSLGCVELPYAAGETAFNAMAIGDLVTVTG